MKNKLSARRGAAGWIILILALCFAVLVGVFITLSHDDKELERQRAVKYVTSMVSVDTLGSVPRVDTEVIYDYGEDVLIAVRYRIETEGKEPVTGSYLLHMSDLSQQVYHISDERVYDYDYSKEKHLFARDWGIL